MNKLFLIMAMIPTLLFAGVPQYETTVDTQYPNKQWEIKPVYQGATPLIRFNLNVNGTNWYPSSDWSGFMWYGTNTDWASTSIVRITATFATNLYYVDCQSTNGTFGSNGVFYGGLVMSNGTSQLIEWGRGKIWVTSSGGIGGVNSLSFTNGAYYDHINNTSIVHGIDMTKAITNIYNGGVDAGTTGSVIIAGHIATIHFPDTNAVVTWADGKINSVSNYADTVRDIAFANSNRINTVSNYVVAVSNYADATFYPSNNPDSYVTASVTNGLTTRAYVDAQFYPSNNPNGYVTQTVTNGLVTEAFVTNHTIDLYKLDGSRALTGNVNAGNNDITNAKTIRANSILLVSSLSCTALYASSLISALNEDMTYTINGGNAKRWLWQGGIGSTNYMTLTNNNGVGQLEVGNVVASGNVSGSHGVFTAEVTGLDATETNAFVTLSQLRNSINAGLDLFVTTNKTVAYTNGISPTNATYLLVKSSELGATAVRTNSSSGAGTYISASIYTNQSFTVVNGGAIKADIYISENVAGSMYVKPEIYRYEISSGAFYEWGDASASNIVATGATPQRNSWVISVPPVATNEPFYLASRLKHVAGSASDLIYGVGSNYPSYWSISLPNEVLTSDLYKLDGSRALTGNMDAGQKSITNIASIGMTNGITFQSSVYSGSNAMLFVVGGTNYYLTF